MRAALSADRCQDENMRIEGVDPRDMRWESRSPAYRVYFCTDGGTDEYEVTEADVPEILDWAQAKATETGQNYVLYLRFEDPADGPGLIRLAGWELPSTERTPGEGRRPSHAIDRP